MCGQQCARYHRQGETATCGPFRVQQIPGAGRGLVATRDIARGELVLYSEAAASGPCARSPAQCVVCLVLNPTSACSK